MPALGCIADDFTGGTDVAAALRGAGLSVALLFGVPASDDEIPSTDAVVIALKSRTAPVAEAVSESLTAATWLTSRGTQHLYFKYCSTFDSTDDGNIGPVTDALLQHLSASATVICPASPQHGRTTYLGHLFVGDQLLSDSSMRHHPLTPMTDSNLVRLLSRQTDGVVDKITLPTVRAGVGSIRTAIMQLTSRGVRHIVLDATEHEDLNTLAVPVARMRLATGGAGLAGALGAVLASSTPVNVEPTPKPSPGHTIVLAGSCSATTLAQVKAAGAIMASLRLDPAATADESQMLKRADTWLAENIGSDPIMVYSSAGPDDRERARAAMGPGTSEILERTLGRLAARAVELGATRIVVAGGETSGAVVQALGVRSVLVNDEADPGVPWCTTLDSPRLALLLKSGNFGREDLLVRAATGGQI